MASMAAAASAASDEPAIDPETGIPNEVIFHVPEAAGIFNAELNG